MFHRTFRYGYLVTTLAQLLVLPRQLLSVTDFGTPSFHGLTGGVYKARERIHRIMADMRLLSPASRSRVATAIRTETADSRLLAEWLLSVPAIVARV